MFHLLKRDSSLFGVFRGFASTKAIRNMASKTALVLLAEGAEEIETISAVDVLRRGGVEVTLAGLTGSDVVKCSRNVLIQPDTSFEEARKHGAYDAIVLPGGAKGAEALSKCPKVGEVLKDQNANNRLIAAICAGPLALKSHGIGYGKTVTSHFSVKDKFTDYKFSDDRVVQDGNIITSQGPGTSIEFGLKIVEYLKGKEKANEMMKPLVVAKY